jgi:hypothetical protein
LTPDLSDKERTMGKVPFPPDGMEERHADFETCVKFDSIDFLEFQFKDPAFISPEATGFFKPEIPTGFFAARTTTGQLKPVTNDTEVKVDFLDVATLKFYTCKVRIRKNC